MVLRAREAQIFCCSVLLLVSVAAAAFPQRTHAQAPPASAPPAHSWQLGDVLAHAQQHAPQLRAARARLGLGSAALEGARPALRDNPELEIGVGPRTRTSADPSVDFKVRLQQRFELSGQRAARISAAHGVASLEAVRLAATTFVVRAAVREAFHEALLARERAASARQARDVQAHVVEIARARLAAGDIGPLGVRIAEADLAQATQAAIEAGADEATAQLRLAALAGLPADEALSLVGDLPQPVPLPSAEQLIALAQRSRPARRIALAELVLQDRQLTVANRETWTGASFGLELSHEDRDQNILLATVSAPLPLFAKNQGARAQARAERDITQQELEAQDAQLPMRVRELVIELHAGSERIGVYRRDVLPKFQENLDLIGRAFELGELDALEVSSARARMVEAQRSALDVYRDYLRALAQLELQTGVELSEGSEP